MIKFLVLYMSVDEDMKFFTEIWFNQVFISAFWAWFVAQFMKVIETAIKEKKFDLSRMVGSGGMPSSHASFVMAMSTTVGLVYGWSSAMYGIALVTSLIVMYDASGVRRSVGKQASILNQIIEDMTSDKPFSEEKLKELVGHTPVQVLAGAILGVLVSNFMILFY